MAQYRYNGSILVKKSSREDYRFAAVLLHTDGKYYKVFISTTREKVQAMIDTEINTGLNTIANHRRAIKAIEEGKDTYTVKEYGHTFTAHIKYEREDYEGWIAKIEDRIKFIEENWKIVEVEKV